MASKSDEPYLRELTDSMAGTYPEVLQRLGRNGVRKRIESGIKRAVALGIERQANVLRYVHLLFVLDRDDIDSAPETAWAGTILGWTGADENLKLSALEKRAQQEQLAAMSQ